MSSAKQVQKYSGQRITFTSTLSAAQITESLDHELRKDVSEDFMKYAQKHVQAGDKKGFEEAIHSKTGDMGFMLAGMFPYHPFMPFYTDKPIPFIRRYNLGSPLLAQSLIKHTPIGGLHAPFTLVVVGELGNSPASVVYDLPSSLIAIGVEGEEQELIAAAEVIDGKLEALVRMITGN